MDEKIGKLVLLINTWLEHEPNISLERLKQDGYSEHIVNSALALNYIKRINVEDFIGFTLTPDGHRLVRELKKEIKKEFPKNKKEFNEYIKENKRIIPKNLRFNTTYSELECPLCKKLNKGTRYGFNICVECDKKITLNTTKLNRFKSFFKKRNINWNKWQAISAIIGTIIIILTFFGININQKHTNSIDFPLNFEAKFTNIVLNDNNQNPNYQGFTNLTLEIWTSHLSRGLITIKNMSFNDEINSHLSTTVDLPTDKYYLEFTNYSFSTDDKHSIKNVSLPVKINKLWIDPNDLAWGTKFNIGIVRLKVEVRDIVTNKTVSKEYNIPVIWNNEK